MEKLYKEWVSEDHHKDNLFIYDGVIEYEHWNRADVKVLFLLKEAYHKSREDGEWDLISEYLNTNLAKSRTFRPLGQWAYGIKKINATGEVNPFCNDKSKLDKALKECAVINLKKSSGNKKSTYADLKKYVDKDWEKYIKKQIGNIKPDIVICGKTWSLIKNNLEGHVSISENIYQHNNIYYVDYYHPAYVVPNMMKYYALCSVIKQSGILKKL